METKRKKQRKIYLNDAEWEQFEQNGGVKTLELFLKYKRFNLHWLEHDEDGYSVY